MGANISGGGAVANGLNLPVRSDAAKVTTQDTELVMAEGAYGRQPGRGTLLGLTHYLSEPESAPILPIIALSLIMIVLIVGLVMLTTREFRRAAEAAMRIKLLENSTRVLASVAAGCTTPDAQALVVRSAAFADTELRNAVALLVQDGGKIVAYSGTQLEQQGAAALPANVAQFPNIGKTIASVFAAGGGLAQLSTGGNDTVDPQPGSSVSIPYLYLAKLSANSNLAVVVVLPQEKATAESNNWSLWTSPGEYL